MFRLAVAFALSASALGLELRRGGALAPPWASDSTCDLHSLAEASGASLGVLAFGDATLESASVATEGPDAKKMAALQDAKQEYIDLKKKMMAVEQRLMGAMDALLEVPVTNGTALTTLLEKKQQNALVVFYAPWCGHCQQFVLHDGKGDPTKAPLEVFRRDLAGDSATKGVAVQRFDVTKGKDMPKAFEVKFIPTVYFVAQTGVVTKFEGNPGDLQALKGFVTEHQTK